MSEYHPPTGYDPDKVRWVARAICKNDGFDPDRLIYSGKPEKIPRGGYAADGKPEAAWLLYWSLAETAIGALENYRKKPNDQS